MAPFFAKIGMRQWKVLSDLKMTIQVKAIAFDWLSKLLKFVAKEKSTKMFYRVMKRNCLPQNDLHNCIFQLVSVIGSVLFSNWK